MEQMHNEVMDQLREQAASREAELKQIIDENSAALQAKEKEALDLHVTLTEAKERVLREEERNRQREHELFAENLNIRRQQRDMKEMANEFMLKWRIAEEQRAKLVDSFNELQAEGIVTRERLRDTWKKEVEETLTHSRLQTQRQRINKPPWSSSSANTKGRIGGQSSANRHGRHSHQDPDR